MRYERKYRIENTAPHLVEQIVRMHPASFRTAYPDRQVNNIYFDTPSFAAFHENESGVAQRKKYRLRWYGPFLQIMEKLVLEVKIKENLLGYKESYPLGNFSFQQLEAVSAQVNRKIADYQLLLPTLMNSYQRSYWVTPNNKIRLTIDSQMYFHPLYKQRNFSKYHLHDPAVIVEVKYDEKEESAAREIMQHLPFRITKNSKYVNGMTWK